MASAFAAKEFLLAEGGKGSGLGGLPGIGAIVAKGTDASRVRAMVRKRMVVFVEGGLGCG